MHLIVVYLRHHHNHCYHSLYVLWVQSLGRETTSVEQYVAFIYSPSFLSATPHNDTCPTQINDTSLTCSSHRILHLWKLLKHDQQNNKPKLQIIFYAILSVLLSIDHTGPATIPFSLYYYETS